MQTKKVIHSHPTTSFSYGRHMWRSYAEGIEREWLITNGIGGYANLTITNSNARSFSGLLNASFEPPSDRYTLLANIREQISFPKNQSDSIQKSPIYDLNSIHKISETIEGQRYLSHFEYDAYPAFTYQVGDVILTKKIGMEYGTNTVAVCYEIQNQDEEALLSITPFFTFKPLGSSCSQKDLAFTIHSSDQNLVLTPQTKPDIQIHFFCSDGEYVPRSQYPVDMATPTHEYIDGILYDLDIRNGLNTSDTYYTPYDIILTLKPHTLHRFYIICSTQEATVDGCEILKSMSTRKQELINRLPISDPVLNELAYSADHFIVSRISTQHKTILAGYPWFLDWGRDTMIAFTGLTLSTRRFDDAKSILLSFIQYIKHGLLPNVFPNQPDALPQYNTMDASLWYFQAVYQYMKYSPTQETSQFILEQIDPVLQEIIQWYQNGTDFHIKMDEDGLIMGGSGKDQITWMDVRIGDWVVTPRHGKPVEINALWYNALMIMSTLHPNDSIYLSLAQKVKKSFQQKFWNPNTNCLNDVICLDEYKVEHADETIRPNQIFAVSLPYTMLNEQQESSIVSTVYRELYTPLGIRSLSSKDANYKGIYIGPLRNRDAAYHMGTSWAFLTGPFLTSYLKVHHHSSASIQTALQLITPLVDHMYDGCLGGIAEIFDGDSPCTSRGCYSQAWSVGELIRVYEQDLLPYTHDK